MFYCQSNFLFLAPKINFSSSSFKLINVLSNNNGCLLIVLINCCQPKTLFCRFYVSKCRIFSVFKEFPLYFKPFYEKKCSAFIFKLCFNFSSFWFKFDPSDTSLSLCQSAIKFLINSVSNNRLLINNLLFLLTIYK